MPAFLAPGKSFPTPRPASGAAEAGKPLANTRGFPWERPRTGRPAKDERNACDHMRFSRSEQSTVKQIKARLDRDRPELAARVRAGELSANAAAIEAGFRDCELSH